MDTHLTDAVFNDLLDPTITLLDVCRQHAIPIENLPAILSSDPFRIATEALHAATDLRAKALAPERRERALATLDTIVRQPPTSPAHTDCIRRAAGALLRATQPPRESSKKSPASRPYPEQPAEPAHAPTDSSETAVIGPETPTPPSFRDKSPGPMADVEASNHQPQGARDACHGRAASAGC